MRGRQEGQSQRKNDDRAEVGMCAPIMEDEPHAKYAGGIWKLQKGKGRDSPLEPPEGTQFC